MVKQKEQENKASDVYKRQVLTILRREIQLLLMVFVATGLMEMDPGKVLSIKSDWMLPLIWVCLLYTSRWMPNGWGTPTLYDFSAQIACGDRIVAEQSHRIGLRTIRMTFFIMYLHFDSRAIDE